jgi:hypothetical protein
VSKAKRVFQANRRAVFILGRDGFVRQYGDRIQRSRWWWMVQAVNRDAD